MPINDFDMNSPQFRRKLTEATKKLENPKGKFPSKLEIMWLNIQKKVGKSLLLKNFKLWSMIWNGGIKDSYVNSVKKAEPKAFFNDEGFAESLAGEYFEDHGLKLAKMLTQTDINRLKKDLKDSWGVGEREFERKYRDNYTLSPSRMKMIYRSEHHRTQNEAVLGVAKKLDREFKQWMVIGDDRSCKICKRFIDNEKEGVMNSIVPVDEPFVDPDTNDLYEIPQDSHPSCRCSMITLREKDLTQFQRQKLIEKGYLDAPDEKPATGDVDNTPWMQTRVENDGQSEEYVVPDDISITHKENSKCPLDSHEAGRFTCGGSRDLIKEYDNIGLKNAIRNTKGAKLTKDGIELDITRFQEPSQSGSLALRTGVFYLPEKNSPLETAYDNPESNIYGGSEKIQERAVFKNPLIIKGTTGGEVPERAYVSIKGDKILNKLNKVVYENITTLIEDGDGPDNIIRNIENVLSGFGGDKTFAKPIYDTLKNEDSPDVIGLTVKEHIFAHAIRAKGYDSVIGIEREGGKSTRLSEVFDLRKTHNPIKENSNECHDPETGKFCEGIKSNSNCPDDEKVGTGEGSCGGKVGGSQKFKEVSQTYIPELGGVHITRFKYGDKEIIVRANNKEQNGNILKAVGMLSSSDQKNVPDFTVMKIKDGSKSKYFSRLSTLGIQPNLSPDEIKGEIENYLRSKVQTTEKTESVNGKNSIIVSAVEKAISEDVRRLHHGYIPKKGKLLTTSDTGFWITKDGSIFKHKDLAKIPKEDRTDLVNIHSHGGQSRDKDGNLLDIPSFEGVSSFSAGDINMFKQSWKDNYSSTMGVMVKDDEMDIIQVPDNADSKKLKNFYTLSTSAIEKEFRTTGDLEDSRTQLKKACDKYGLEFIKGVKFKSGMKQNEVYVEPIEAIKLNYKCKKGDKNPDTNECADTKSSVSSATFKSIKDVKSRDDFQIFMSSKRAETLSRPEVRDAITNTEGAKVTDKGLEMTVVRYQEPEQAGSLALRSGVFYLPEAKSPYARHYKSTKNEYGGPERMEGKTIFRNPLIIKGATGGAVPERAYTLLEGKSKLMALQDEISKKITGASYYVNTGQVSPNKVVSEIENILERYGGDPGYANEIYENTKKGNLRRYAIQEHIIAARIRKEGYDALIGIGTHKGKPRFSEVLDVRTNENPFQDGWEDDYEWFYDDYVDNYIKNEKE
jgi:hypothetical protein